MSYWTDVKDVLLKGIDLALSNFKVTAESAIEKGKDGVVYLQLKKDLFIAHRDLQNSLADLGDIVNELYKSKNDIYTDEKVKEVVGKISAIENKCREIEKKMSDFVHKKAG